MDFFSYILLATARNQDEEVQVLVDAGANPNLQDKAGRTACYYNRRYDYIMNGCAGCSSDSDCQECCGGCNGLCCDKSPDQDVSYKCGNVHG